MKLTLFLTEKCSRRCKYCDIGNLKTRSKPALIYLKNYLQAIRIRSDVNKVVLTGGEIGTLSETILDYIFELLNNKNIQVNTNGLFLRKYYDRYKDYINSIMYHPVSEITDTIEYEPVINNLRYHFPVHKQNIIYLANFLDRYSHIQFEVSPYDAKTNQDQFKLELEDFNFIYNIIKDRNVSEYSIYMFNKIISIWEKREQYRTACINTSNDYSIDFVNGQIKKCVCSHSRSPFIVLNCDNLDDLLLNRIKFNKTSICNDCFHFINILRHIKK